MYYLINVGTERPLGRGNCSVVYKTESSAKAARTRMNKEYKGPQWDIMEVSVYNSRPIKMVERVNFMTGEKFMEAEDTPYFCSPSSETYWTT